MKRFPYLVARIAIVAAGCMALHACTPAQAPEPASAPAKARQDLRLGSSINLDEYRDNRAFPPAGAHTRSRLAKGCTNCWTDVVIQAYAWSRFYGSDNFPAIGDDSILVGHIKNIGTRETEMYNLKPSTLAEYDVYVTNNAGAPGWVIIEVPNGPIGVLVAKGHGKFNACVGHPGHPAKSYADFRNCDYGAFRGGALKLASLAGWEELIARALGKRNGEFAVEDPGWFSCSDGCCTLAI